jgi:dihydroxy-acid dehydratase
MYLDRILLVLVGLLLASVAAFLAGLIPYPFGLIVLSVFILGRILYLKGRKQ